MSASSSQTAALLQFVNGLSIALVLAFVALLLRHALKFKGTWGYALYDGVMFGMIGIAIMQFPFPIEPGAALDVRVVPVAIAGLFSNPAAAIIAGAIVGGYRMFLGGPGVIAGTGAILTAAALGAVFADRWRGNLDRIGLGALMLVGLGLVVITLGWTLILPTDIVGAALKTYTIPVLITHPLGVIVLGSLVFYEQKRRRTELALRESEARLSAIAENSPTAIYLKDLDGRYTLINDLFAERLGIPRDEIIGQTATDFLLQNLSLRVQDQDRKVIESRRPQTFEVEMPYADGTTHIEMAVKFPIFDADGTATGLGGLSTDITEWKRAEEAARRNEARFREFFEKAHLLFLSLDSDARVIACNDYVVRLTGFDRSDLLGRDWIETAVPEDERPMIRGVFQEALQSNRHETPLHFENDIQTRTGEKRRIVWDSVVTQNPADTAPTTIAVGADVTEQRHAEAEAQSLRDRLAHVARVGTMGEMATGFAHELNQPLAAINNYAHGTLLRLERDPIDVHEIVRALTQLAKQAERAGEIIRRIRSFVKKNAPAKIPTDLNRSILDALAFLKVDAADAGVTLHLALDKTLPEIAADSVQIQQVVINLVKNAIEVLRTVHDRPPRIEIGTLAIDGRRVEVTVSDNGPGLPPEIIADLFEPFVTTKTDGMGIGLSICRSTVQAHGGELTAAPRPDNGTVFRFVLPISEES